MLPYFYEVKKIDKKLEVIKNPLKKILLDQLEESNKKFISLAFTFIREESFIGETSG